MNLGCSLIAARRLCLFMVLSRPMSTVFELVLDLSMCTLEWTLLSRIIRVTLPGHTTRVLCGTDSMQLVSCGCTIVHL